MSTPDSTNNLHPTFASPVDAWGPVDAPKVTSAKAASAESPPAGAPSSGPVNNEGKMAIILMIFFIQFGAYLIFFYGNKVPFLKSLSLLPNLDYTYAHETYSNPVPILPAPFQAVPWLFETIFLTKGFKFFKLFLTAAAAVASAYFAQKVVDGKIGEAKMVAVFVVIISVLTFALVAYRHAYGTYYLTHTGKEPEVIEGKVVADDGADSPTLVETGVAVTANPSSTEPEGGFMKNMGEMGKSVSDLFSRSLGGRGGEKEDDN